MALAFVIVACILFLLAAVKPDLVPHVSPGWLGLFFWAASTLVGKV